MATNPLDPSFIPGTDRQVNRGHGTGALGPSDSSDNGSDVHGGGAERQIGDAELDSDSDRFGTGERRGAAPDEEVADGADITPDHIEPLPDEEDDGGE